MKAVTGVFHSAADARRASEQLRSTGSQEERITLLTPGSDDAHLRSVPTVAAEQPGMGKAVGAVVGGAAGLSAGPLVMALMIPGVGPITAIGLLAGAFAGAAGAGTPQPSAAGAAAAGRHLAGLAQAWDNVNRTAREVEVFNLERKPFVFKVFGWLAEAAGG